MTAIEVRLSIGLSNGADNTIPNTVDELNAAQKVIIDDKRRQFESQYRAIGHRLRIEETQRWIQAN